MIAVIDYGMGNLRSVQKGFERVGHPARIVRTPEEVAAASHIVLPGVGGFPECMENLVRSGMVEAILAGIGEGKPFLGICLGLQLLFTESEEFGRHEGLGVVPGRVIRFTGEPFDNHPEMKIPHMGWNRLRVLKDDPLLSGVPDGSYVYFVHSYHGVPTDDGVVSAVTDYGIPFVSAIRRGSLHACQFHPEKSQEVGLRILQNFGNLK